MSDNARAQQHDDTTVIVETPAAEGVPGDSCEFSITQNSGSPIVRSPMGIQDLGFPLLSLHDVNLRDLPIVASPVPGVTSPVENSSPHWSDSSTARSPIIERSLDFVPSVDSCQADPCKVAEIFGILKQEGHTTAGNLPDTIQTRTLRLVCTKVKSELDMRSMLDLECAPCKGAKMRVRAHGNFCDACGFRIQKEREVAHEPLRWGLIQVRSYAKN